MFYREAYIQFCNRENIYYTLASEIIILFWAYEVTLLFMACVIGFRKLIKIIIIIIKFTSVTVNLLSMLRIAYSNIYCKIIATFHTYSQTESTDAMDWTKQTGPYRIQRTVDKAFKLFTPFWNVDDQFDWLLSDVANQWWPLKNSLLYFHFSHFPVHASPWALYCVNWKNVSSGYQCPENHIYIFCFQNWELLPTFRTAAISCRSNSVCYTPTSRG